MPPVARKLVGWLTVALLSMVGLEVVGPKPWLGGVFLGLAAYRAYHLLKAGRRDAALRALAEIEEEERRLFGPPAK